LIVTHDPSFEQGAFNPFATEEDIRNCFRLILGRFPQDQEWPGHSARAGERLANVISTFVNSLEFHNRGLMERTDTRFELVKLDGFSMYGSPDDLAVGKVLIGAGNYEPSVSNMFRKYLKPGMRVLDVGANIGFYAMLAASRVGPTGTVIAVEPNPANVSLMMASRALNGFENVRIVQAAAYDKWDTLCLFVDASNGCVAPVTSDQPSALRNTVMALPLGVFLLGGGVDLIKIDVEGAEGRAVNGMIEVIERCRPTIFSEFTPEAMPSMSGMSAEDYLNLFILRGYRVQVLQLSGPVDCGNDARRVLTEYARCGRDHVDILCECSGSLSDS
jgi:FkbM family methyltransferase